MAQKSKDGDSYREFSDSLKSGRIGCLYIFYGEERYLLERCITEIRSQLCPDGLDGFNYRRFEGRGLSIDALSDAIDTLPVYADRTLIEIHDFDVFGYDQKQRLADKFADLPDYICIVIAYDTIPYKPDGRVSLDKEILKAAQAVDFAVQGNNMLVKWIHRHFEAAGKLISTADAEYLVLITGGYMSSLHSEVEKAAAYASGETVTRADIDAVVTPVLDAAVYKLTDALIRREHNVAMGILDELLRMREPPQRIIYSISAKMRQFLAARVCIENSLGRKDLCEMCGIRHEFQAKLLMETARKTTLANCRNAVLLCVDTAYALNSSPEPEARLTELIARLAFQS